MYFVQKQTLIIAIQKQIKTEHRTLIKCNENVQNLTICLDEGQMTA